MKTLKNLGLALVTLSLLALPAMADKGKKDQHNNNGTTKQHGQARAEKVQVTSKKGDKDPSPSKGSKSMGKHLGWGKKGKHDAKGHDKK